MKNVEEERNVFNIRVLRIYYYSFDFVVAAKRRLQLTNIVSVVCSLLFHYSFGRVDGMPASRSLACIRTDRTRIYDETTRCKLVPPFRASKRKSSSIDVNAVQTSDFIADRSPLRLSAHTLTIVRVR